MKTHLLFFTAILSVSALTSCVDYVEGPAGPQGPMGAQGPEGAPGESGYVFEYENITFTSPSYDVVLDFPSHFEGLDSDVALVYFLWEVQSIEGQNIEVWRQLPQTVFTDDGILTYNFDHTKYDARVFMDANYPLSWLTAFDTDEWIARVVVVPGSFFSSGRVDVSDYSAVKEALGLPDFDKERTPFSRSR
ncbi:MAG: collagen-like protein [Cyclobacteriaceae bacterium]